MLLMRKILRTANPTTKTHFFGILCTTSAGLSAAGMHGIFCFIGRRLKAAQKRNYAFGMQQFSPHFNLYFPCMSIHFIKPKKSVNSAFLKIPVSIEKMERFSTSLMNLSKKRNLERDEEYHKGEIWKFLRGIFEPIIRCR